MCDSSVTSSSRIAAGVLLGAVTAAAMFLFAGCGGASSAAQDISALTPEPASSQSAAAAPQGMPTLPKPSEISRDASVIESSLVLNGATFRDDLTHQNVSVSGESCIYDPSFTSGDNPLYSQVALAIYSFDISAVSDELLSAVELNVDGVPDLVIGTSHVFAGLPSLSLDKWDWSALEKKPSSSAPAQIESWSWGASNAGSLRARSPQGVLNVCVVVFGDTALDVSRVALTAPSSPTSPPVMQELFRKGGWNLKENVKARLGSSISLDCDDSDRVHATVFDDSNGQLYYFQVEGRSVREMAVDCDAVVGTSNSVCVAPDGSLFLAYTDDNLHQGVFRTMAPDMFSSLTWSPRSNFDNGDDGTGVMSDVGAQARCIFDDTGSAHVFYLDSSSHELRHASRLNGLPPGTPWTVQVVSPPGEQASCPAPVRCPDGTCVAYLSRTPGSSSVRLMLATQDAVGAWSSLVLADDVHVPDGIGDEDCDGFCDGSVRPGTDEVVVAYSSPTGFSLVHFDLSSSTVRLRESPSRPSSSGAFVRCAVLGDGSVRLAHYDTASRTIFFENGDVPTGEDFVSLPAVQYNDPDDDCDGLDFWVDPDEDGDGLHQTVLVELSSSVSALTGSGKKEFKGHVTLLK